MATPLLRLAWRESRTARRRLLLYMSSITLGVAALVAIDSFAGNTTRSIREQSRELLGGDIAISSRQAFTPALDSLLDSLSGPAGYPVARVTTFASMALALRTGQTRLAQVRAVTPNFPLYGAVVTRPAGQWARLASAPVAFVDPSLLIALDAQVGDTIQLGFMQFAIAGTVDQIPGDPGVAQAIGPRVFIADRWVAATRLLGFGSRAEYEATLRLPEGTSPGRWAIPVRPRVQAAQARLRTVTQTEVDATEAIAQLARFLSVVGLVALLLGGIGVASGVNAFVQRKVDTVAVLRCLGATGNQVLAVYALQAAAMGLAGAAAGVALGVAVQFALPAVIGDFLPVDVRVRLEPRAILLGLAVGVWVALVFALRPLLALRRVSPLTALRHDAAALAAAERRDPLALLVNLALVGSVVALAFSRAASAREGAILTLGVFASIATLVASASALTWAARAVLRPAWPYLLRQGIANLYRPANQTRAVVIALGFGAFLVSTLVLVQANLARRFDLSAAAARGNLVFFDVQDDQRAGVDSLVRAAGQQVVESVPIVTMRLVGINGMQSPQYAEAKGLPPNFWAFRREYRSTYRDTLVATETLRQGRWFDAPTADTLPQVSLERDLAAELHLALGDRLTWDVQGREITVRLTSIREVNWGRFEPNFFAVFEPRALRGAPQQHLIVGAVASDTLVARLQRDAVRRYPNVSSIDLSLVLGTIGRIVERVAVAVRFLALFSFAMGVPVLFSAVAATRRERLRESVLLKTLGATRGQVGWILLAEYAVLGALGALAGMVLSIGGAWALMTWVFEEPFVLAAGPVSAIAAVMMSLAVGIGLLTGREVFRETPMAALREA